jgi:hypothetical protein
MHEHSATTVSYHVVMTTRTSPAGTEASRVTSEKKPFPHDVTPALAIIKICLHCAGRAAVPRWLSKQQWPMYHTPVKCAGHIPVPYGKLESSYVGSEGLAAVLMKITTLSDITPCSKLKVNGSFEGTYRLHLQDRISRERYHPLSRWYLVRLVRKDIGVYIILHLILER